MTYPEKIWLNGKIISYDQGTVPVLSHTLHYGSGAFEGIRFYKTDDGPAIFRLEDHLNRLIFSAETMGMKVPYTKAEIQEAIEKLITINEIEEGYIRPLFYYGAKIGLSPKNGVTQAAVIVMSWGSYLGEKRAVKVSISPFIRPHPKSIVAEAKVTGVYQNSILASIDAHKKGCDEALLLDHEGNIAEGPGENIFFIQGNTLITPQKGNILSGITRSTIIEAAADLGFKTEERKIALQDMLQFDEAFFTGTAAEVTPIEQIDKRYYQVDKGVKIQQYYANIVRGKVADYKHFLTFVNKS
jgi:branched-chain amino acid aminotransferase